MEALRSLENYKEMHKDKAREKGVEKELSSARTLTQARRVLFGEKKKQYIAQRSRGSNK